MRLAFDIETNGLMPEVNKIQCINIIDIDTKQEYRFTDHEFYRDPYTGEPDTSHEGVCPRDGDIFQGIYMLEEAAMAVAHNGIGYDFPVLEHVRGANFSKVLKRCTQVSAALIYTDVKARDFACRKTGKLPEAFFKARLAGSHSLKAWGYRLGELKDDFDPKNFGHTWATMPFCKAEDDYCMQDVRTLVKLWELIESQNYSEQALQLEHDVKAIINRQEQHGWLIDLPAAKLLAAELQKQKFDLEEKCRTLYPPFFAAASTRPFTPKRDNVKMGYCAGASMTKIKLVDFNLSSRQHVADRLIKVEGWEPIEFTPTGQPKVDETILEALPYSTAKMLAEYFTTTKRLGQVSDGDEAWLKRVKADGRVHGRVNTNGAVTGRMTHFHPNVSQVDKHPSMRSLWIVPLNMKLVGCDADGLEMRMMAHYLAPYDGGAYVKVILNGSSADGTDAHSRNQRSLKFNVRRNAKTFFYAMLYGAGDFKLGTIVVADMLEATREKFYAAYPPGHARKMATIRLGRGRRAALVDGIAGMKKLLAKLKEAAKRGWIKGLDGRRITVRSMHAALNTLFQGAGAVVMKQALVLADEALPTGHYEFVGNIHDEFQIESTQEKADVIGQLCADSIRRAGEVLALRCPLAGNFDVGNNWSETH